MASDDRRHDSAARPARILLVDDSSITRIIVGRGLKSAGMLIEEARDGAEALQLLTANAYDVVISDLSMPGIDGFAVLAGARMQPVPPEVIILSGSEDIQRAMDALRLGAHAYLAKPPAHPDEVLLTVRRALEMKRLRERCALLEEEATPRRARAARSRAAAA